MRRRSITTLAVLTGLALATVLVAQAPDTHRTDDMFQAETLPKSEAEALILRVIEELQPVRGQFQNVPPEDGRLLRVLTEAIGAQHVVELGTSNGYSGLWFCMALRATGGTLTTFEIDRERIAIARGNFTRAGVQDLVTIVEGDAHERILELSDPIDLVFIDADKRGYIDYPQELKKLLTSRRTRRCPQHDDSHGGPAIRRGHHHRHRPGDRVPAHGRRGDGRLAQEAVSTNRASAAPGDGHGERDAGTP